jgi:catechol 2,3-dioxygenase-like lactoylglutathione lyase family enzyme
MPLATLTAFVASTDPARAKAFYRDTLGLRLVSEDPFALVFDSQGIPVRIQKVEAFTPQPFTVLGWNVPDLPATVGELAGRGVRFERYPSLDQDERGIWQAPGGAQVAWFRDPDGNVLSLTQHPPR